MDRLYMTYIQATQGGGGWPMSVFLTPELQPFLGGVPGCNSSYLCVLGVGGKEVRNERRLEREREPREGEGEQEALFSPGPSLSLCLSVPERPSLSTPSISRA